MTFHDSVEYEVALKAYEKRVGERPAHDGLPFERQRLLDAVAMLTMARSVVDGDDVEPVGDRVVNYFVDHSRHEILGAAVALAMLSATSRGDDTGQLQRISLSALDLD